MKILFLEDDPVIADTLSDFLNEFYEVTHCFNSHSALEKAEDNHYDLYIFDINVPGISGMELLKTLRTFNDTTPTIFITAYQELKYLQEGFKLGANDFIRKPFELEELQARIENIRRQFLIEEEVCISEEIRFSPEIHQLLINDKTFSISPKESELLHYLLKNRSKVISNDELLQNLYTYESMPSSDTIRTYIKRLRQLLGKERILNIRGEGYRFE